MIEVIPTKRPCDCENIADFSRYYRFSWISWYEHPEGPAPIYIQQVTDDVVFATDLLGFMHQIPWRTAQANFSFAMPDLGMVNGESSILYLYQTSPRQAHKGYRPTVVSSALFNGWDLRKLAMQPHPGDKDVLRNLFFPKYYAVEEAIKLLADGERVGCALNDRIALYTTAHEKYPALAFRRRTVGYLENERKAVIANCYLEEAAAVHKRLGVEVSIT